MGGTDAEIKALDVITFQNLPLLRYLGLHLDSEASLPDGIFDNLNSLQTLSISGGNLSLLPTNLFKNQSSLKKLYLVKSQVSNIPDGFFSTNSQLSEVHLELNLLPPTFQTKLQQDYPNIKFSF
jgi:hypothetical protein